MQILSLLGWLYLYLCRKERTILSEFNRKIWKKERTTYRRYLSICRKESDDMEKIKLPSAFGGMK